MISYLCPTSLISGEIPTETTILTDCNSDVAGIVRRDRYKIGAYDCEVMVINAEDVSRVKRCIDDSQ